MDEVEKEKIRQCRRKAYQMAKASREQDPQFVALKELKKAQRRELSRETKERQKTYRKTLKLNKVNKENRVREKNQREKDDELAKALFAASDLIDE